jgi:hypothetical protein
VSQLDLFLCLSGRFPIEVDWRRWYLVVRVRRWFFIRRIVLVPFSWKYHVWCQLRTVLWNPFQGQRE